VKQNKNHHNVNKKWNYTNKQQQCSTTKDQLIKRQFRAICSKIMRSHVLFMQTWRIQKLKNSSLAAISSEEILLANFFWKHAWIHEGIRAVIMNVRGLQRWCEQADCNDVACSTHT
jgi:hypothetical protein